VRAGAVQLNSTEDSDRNLETADRLVRAAVAAGAELVALPEKWSVLGTPEQIAAGAQPLDGRAIGWARGIARELGIDLVAGSIAERVEGHEKTFNTSVHIRPDGEPAGVYRKIHMFDVEVDGVRYRESEREEPGEEIVVSELAGGVRLGMSVCYDLRFPELYRALAGAGAEILAVPANFLERTGRDHWEVLLRARAIENGAYVIAPAQIGSSSGVAAHGRSMVIDPWGTILAQAADEVAIIHAELDLERVASIRSQIPVLANRRPAAIRV